MSNDNDENQEPATVFLVDDDASVRTAFTRGLTAEGFTVRSWDSADAFLRDHDPSEPGCLVADVTMPGTTGLELQALLANSGCARPIVFVTAHGNVPMSVQAMRAGAVTFLPKPVRLAELAAAIREACERDRMNRQRSARREAVQTRFRCLTARERERSEEHTSELQSLRHLVCRLLLEKKKL